MNKIQFDSFYIKMWLSSLNIFEGNQIYEIKKDKHLKVRMNSKNEKHFDKRFNNKCVSH